MQDKVINIRDHLIKKLQEFCAKCAKRHAKLEVNAVFITKEGFMRLDVIRAPLHRYDLPVFGSPEIIKPGDPITSNCRVKTFYKAEVTDDGIWVYEEA